MKRQIVAGGILLALVAGITACNRDKPTAKPASEDARAAYIIGFNMGTNMQSHLPKMDMDSFVAGMKDAYAKKPSALTPEETKATMMAFETRMRAEAEEKRKKDTEAATAKGNAYLAENAKKPGVKTTASGLQYEVLTEGTGPKPKATDTVKVHYEGKLVDGTVFDSSLKRNEPATFPLNQVIPGWTEGVQLMPVGSKYRLVVPPGLAYGDQSGGPIPPNSVLIFEVQLLDIVK